MRIRPSRAVSLVAAGLLIAALTTDASSVVAPPPARAAPTGPTLPLGHIGTLDDRRRRSRRRAARAQPGVQGAAVRAVRRRVRRRRRGFPCQPTALTRCGWASSGRPWSRSPGSYDDNYLASIAQTVATLASHGIVSLLDFHQDLYNEAFQGEGAPAWAVQTGGLPNPQLGFPGNYFAQPRRGVRVERLLARRPGTGRDRAAGPLRARLGTRRGLLPRQSGSVRLRGAQRAVARLHLGADASTRSWAARCRTTS